jgi:hypothetical protein
MARRSPAAGTDTEVEMHAHLVPQTHRVERPAYVWPAIALEVITAALAIPVGWAFIVDPSGGAMGVPQDWIAGSFGSYLIPGLYLFAMNGLMMLVLAGLSAYRHWVAPWLTGVLGVGLIIWIAVQLLVMPETMILQWIFLAVGFILGLVALFWLRQTDQLRLW